MGEMLEMAVDSIRVSLVNYQRVVILRAKESDRYLPIWIGPSEADAIAVKLQDVSVPRPLTHDLLRAVITALGAEINHIVVSDLSNDTFYAKVVIRHNGNTMEVDSRPSDAIALAVRTQSPIYAEDVVLEKAGVQMDAESGKPVVRDQTIEVPPLSDVELKSLSAFTDFVNTLDMEGLGHEEHPPSDRPEST